MIEALKDLEAISDPIARAQAITQVLAYQDERAPELRKLRREAVVQLRSQDPPMPYRQIAAKLGVSLGTVQSIERGHAGAWGTKRRTKKKADESSPEE